MYRSLANRDQQKIQTRVLCKIICPNVLGCGASVDFGGGAGRGGNRGARFVARIALGSGRRHVGLRCALAAQGKGGGAPALAGTSVDVRGGDGVGRGLTNLDLQPASALSFTPMGGDKINSLLSLLGAHLWKAGICSPNRTTLLQTYCLSSRTYQCFEY